MAEKIKLTRPELKRRRDRLARFERYLPMLKLKQQQLQITLREVAQQVRQAQQALDEIEAKLARYESVLADRSGISLQQLSRPKRVLTSHRNIAGVRVPEFLDVKFPEDRYSLFGTPAWVDDTLKDLRQRNGRQEVLKVMRDKETLLQGELARVIQRVNLFEKVMIPRDREAIRRIRIKLGDEMAAAVGRGKIAKGKLAKVADELPGEAVGVEPWEADA